MERLIFTCVAPCRGQSVETGIIGKIYKFGGSKIMDSRAGSVWVRMKARRWVYTFSILSTLSLGILIGTVVSYGVKGKEGQKASDATPLVVPPPQQLSNAFSQIAKQLEPSVVNINTESTIKNVGRRRRGQVPGDEDGGGGMEDFFRALTAVRFVNALLAPVSLWTPRATSSRIVTSSTKRIAFVCVSRTIHQMCSTMPR
jgi:hypothetical protein